ncbi:hypothetical protein BJY04DRAFT_233399 [Aspergillus karnatakaensis]|uniref:uncharacterized protein n=1 Tax=Aspergillus karnatakaensis TaxID=1810916 RepID=UPI003CCDC7EB
MFLANIPLAATFALAASAFPNPNPIQSSSTTSAAASSTSTPSTGGLTITNNLNATVYLWSTSSTSTTNNMQTIASSGGTYTETWQTTSDGSGISIKMSTSQDQSDVLQFEYTIDGETLFWDLSSIDMSQDSAFVAGGFQAVPDDESCEGVTCNAGDGDCEGAYQEADDVDTLSCDAAGGIVVTLG